MSTGRIRGGNLKVGDVIEVWWAPRRDQIVKLTPYRGALTKDFPDGAQLAEFALLKGSMTIDNGELYTVLNLGGDK